MRKEHQPTNALDALLDSRPCLEMRDLMGSIHPFTVDAYEAHRHRAQHYTSRDAEHLHQLGWTIYARPADKLSPEWRGLQTATFRISHREAYNWQMQRRLRLR
jgi:hypothetical protein